MEYDGWAKLLSGTNWVGIYMVRGWDLKNMRQTEKKTRNNDSLTITLPTNALIVCHLF